LQQVLAGADQPGGRNLAIGLGLINVGARQILLPVEFPIDSQKLVETFDARLGGPDCLARRQDVDVGVVQVLDGQANLVLILGLHHLERARRVDHPSPPLVRIVNRM